ncbi:MAG: FHA domain-containing protein [Tannerella sp.]|jgi:hypothetical protein|nr:FHA domain-containing protein [Tannerella sp.]
MRISIGKAKDNDFVIDNPDISRYHAVLFRDDENGCLYLEDSGSTNGTYVNNNQIVRKKVRYDDSVTLGSDYHTSVAEFLHSMNDYSEEFAELKDVYNTYIKEKIRVQSANQFKTRLFQSLPFALIGIVGIVLGFMGQTNKGLFILSFIVAVLAPTVGIYFGARQAAKIPALLQNLANKFKIDYVCPKCGIFLGEIPWESLVNKKQCQITSCQAKWIRT